MSQAPEEVTERTYYELPDEMPEPKDDPIARTLEALAQQQITQSKMMEELARRQNTPTPVTIQTTQQQPTTSDPIDVIQNDVNNLKNQLDQLRQNSDIDDTEYWTKYQSLIAPKIEQIKDLKYNRQLEETKQTLQKTYDEKLSEQQKLLESIQNENRSKTEEQKLQMMVNQYPQLSQENSPLLVEMSKLLEDPAISSVFSDPRNNKAQYFALAKLADSNMKARGVSTSRPDMGITGSPNVYQGDSGRRVAFTADEVSELKSQGYDDNGIMKLSNYAEQVKNTGSVTLIGWVAKHG